VTGVTGLHHVQVAAPPGCEPDARAFYGGLLGLPEIDKPLLLALRGGCWFSLGDGELHVGVEDPFRPAAKAHPALRVGSVADLEEMAAALSRQGTRITWADDAEIPGQRRFYVNDPWGNRLELVAVEGD
jgi:catechol 2,3-dioxygenase-like lactoylglutathione lyase family enzyme